MTTPSKYDHVRPSSGEKTSALLRRVLAALPDEDVSVGYLAVQLRRRSFGGIVFLLALFGLLPGLSILAGLVLILPGLQMAAGFRAPLLPRFIRQRQIDRATLQSAGVRIIPWIETLERYFRPRWLRLTRPPMPNLVGLLVIGLSVVLVLPLPLSNFPPAVALLCLSLGLLERDGLMLGLGLLFALVALAIGVMIADFAIDALLLYLNRRF